MVSLTKHLNLSILGFWEFFILHFFSFSFVIQRPSKHDTFSYLHDYYIFKGFLFLQTYKILWIQILFPFYQKVSCTWILILKACSNIIWYIIVYTSIRIMKLSLACYILCFFFQLSWLEENIHLIRTGFHKYQFTCKLSFQYICKGS